MGQWSNLPMELVQSVYGYLEFVDKVRVRAVCVYWNSSLPLMPRLRSTHLPWLLKACEDNTKGISLFSPHEAKVYPLNLPEAHRKLFKGSSHGWVFTVEDTNSTSVDDIYLINPLTRARIQLPPRSTFPDVKEFRPDRVGEEYVLNGVDGSDFYVTHPENESDFFVTDPGQVNVHLMEKVVLSASPSSDDCVVVAMYGEYRKLAWCKCDHKEWTPLHIYSSGPRQPAFMDVIFHKGKLHALNALGKLVVFESIGPDPEVKEVVAEAPESFLTDPMYLVECSNLGLIMVGRYIEVNYDDERCTTLHTSRVKVCKLADSINNSRRCWVEVKDIGDNILFLGLNSSLSISAPDFNFLGYKENSIYFTDDSRAFCGKEDNQEDSDIGVFNLEDGSFKPLLGFKCNPRFLWPPPIWVTPNAY